MTHLPALPAATATLPIVVAGTGTGVGKTYVSRDILATLRLGGRRCLGLKPIETGFVDPEVSDAYGLAASAGHAGITPCFTSPRPESPHRVARAAGAELTAHRLATWVHTRIAEHDPELVLVETAGGLFTPLSATETNLDLVRALEPCLFVLVAADRLGVLHDVLCATKAASASFRAPDLIYLNAIDPSFASLDNADELCRLLPATAVLKCPASRPVTPSDLLALLFTSVRK
jgi:dethiobiotin synthetase